MTLYFVVSSDIIHLVDDSVTNTWADTREVLGGNGRARVLHSRTVLDVDLWSGLLSQGSLSHDTEKCVQVPGVKFGSSFWFRSGCLPACRSVCNMSCVILSAASRSHTSVGHLSPCWTKFYHSFMDMERRAHLEVTELKLCEGSLSIQSVLKY